ncbi:phosphatase PAP2 family protein [Archangium primigenium]|uniref:phosphatase PAP2 family protein n=1 Tax=[Archangium] primigenium TaxID=2792470 RepID=UPI00195C91C7|nr:phosphatase PAP2 family protein [Archangium primigenium]
MARVMASLLRLNAHFGGRLLTTGVAIAGTFQPYFWLNDHLPPRFDFLTPLDTAIPFLPWTYALYSSFFALLLGAAWLLDGHEYLRMLGAVLLANAVCYLGFFLFTAHYPRPPLDSIPPGFWREQFRQMRASDNAGNTFPSIHVATTLLGALRLRHQRGGALWVLWAVLICLSTLTVKQHYVVDVLGGIGVAWGVHALLFRRPVPALAAPVEARS